MRYLFVVFSLLFPILTFAQTGPFGLSWKMSAADIKAQGVSLQPTKTDGLIQLYKATSLPKNVSDIEWYSIAVHETFGLQKVTAVFKDISEDPYGSTGKAKFLSFKEALVEKYGPPKHGAESTGLKLWKEPDEFYQCLAYTGCGVWAHVWSPKGDERGAISIELKGQRASRGYIVIAYEGSLWERAVDERNSKSAASDKKAL